MQVGWQIKYISADKNCKKKKTIEFLIFCDKNKIVIRRKNT